MRRRDTREVIVADWTAADAANSIAAAWKRSRISRVHRGGESEANERVTRTRSHRRNDRELISEREESEKTGHG